ncbi:MAG: hypothetical protein LBT50_08565, partial [Prevotellaceae bacterium]|nr:hypothetical protein [Prevotellaceae bacterium]
MKARGLTFGTLFAFGSVAHQDKKAVETERITLKWTGKIIFSILIFSILCSITLFVSSHQFVNQTVAPKWFGMMICVGLSALILLSILYHNIYTPVKSIFLLILISCSAVFFRDLAVSGFNYYLLAYTVCLFLLFFVLQQITTILPAGVLFRIVVILTTVLAVYGLLQYAGLASSASGFKMTGSFDNPAGFAAALICALPYTFYFFRNASRGIRYVSTTFAFVILLASVLSGSRAAIFASLVVIACYVGSKYSGIKWKKWLKISFL